MAMSAIVELVWFHLTNYDDEEALDDINVLSTNIILNGTLAFNTEVSNIQVFNTIGQVVSTDNDVTNLKNGIYVVVVNANGETVANRFVKK